jgi:hypothetical protein
MVKGFVRHDIFSQRMFRDFSTEMRARYGTGLEGLFDRHLADSAEGMSQVAEGSQTAERGQRRPA